MSDAEDELAYYYFSSGHKVILMEIITATSESKREAWLCPLHFTNEEAVVWGSHMT